ncbi:hypothetical protein BKA63DRAFT_469016 [Paraphoma chrysanthemicola]|nr:hypothetical protein BKA63DRAFT_469016 [Paraphoma chrysanthemicola]
MCYYRLYIFLGCGHSSTSASPVRYCETAKRPHKEDLHDAAEGEVKTTRTGIALDLNAGSKPDWRSAARHSASTTESKRDDEGAPKTLSEEGINVEPCTEGRLHPIYTVKLERVCADCAFEREERLRKLEDMTSEIGFVSAGRYGGSKKFCRNAKEEDRC